MRAEQRGRRFGHIADQRREHAPQAVVQQPPATERGRGTQGRSVAGEDQRQFEQLLVDQQPRTHTVVDVVRVVGDLVGEVAQLRLEARRGLVEKTASDASRFGCFERERAAPRTMLQDAFARLEGQIQAVERRVARFEQVDHAQALEVVLEAVAGRVDLAQALVERVLAGVAERRVAEVVGERNRLAQVLVQAQRPRHRARQLRDLERVGQPGAKQVAFVVQEHLRLVDEAPKRAAVDDAIAVALEVVARRRGRLGMAAPARALRVAGPGAERPGRTTRAAHPVWASMTCATSASGAPRRAARPGESMTTKRISPACAFLSSRISSR